MRDDKIFDYKKQLTCIDRYKILEIINQLQSAHL